MSNRIDATNCTHEAALARVAELESKLSTTAARLEEVEAELYKYVDRLGRIVALVNEQAEDEGLWFVTDRISEDYLQQELRRLHAAIEGVTPDECAKRVVERQTTYDDATIKARDRTP